MDTPWRKGKRPGSKNAFQGYIPKWLKFLLPHTICYGFCQHLSRWGVSLEVMDPWRRPLMMAGDGWCTAQLDETLGRSGEPSISLGSCSLWVPRNLLIGNFNHNLSTLLCHTVCHDQGMMFVPTLRNHGGGGRSRNLLNARATKLLVFLQSWCCIYYLLHISFYCSLARLPTPSSRV